ncbi:MAG: PKD domain-containing protein [Chitinophagaceae bacterium]|nr:MAG: PKD domain-containing protein [Chitinophagaceae bacterium]
MMFVDKSIGATAWLWNFGDGTTSTAQNPSHVFPSFGNYTVTLTATNNGCSHSKTYSLTVFDETPSFTADIRTACKTATINYTASSNNISNIQHYNWNFSNGQTSSTNNPQVIYSTAGNFSTTLITIDKYGCFDTAFQNNYIRINGPTAAFTVPNNQGCTGLNAAFANQSAGDGTNPIVSWLWNFGDGQSRLLTTANPPQHVYPNVGSYTPKLIVTDAIGCKDSLSLPNMINVSKPTASFASADTLNCLGSTVNFSNTSAAQVYTSLWNFGDGTTSTQQNPSHIYTAVGTYNISLSITDQYGCAATFSQNPYIEIKETKAAFTVSDSIGGCTPFEVKFNNASQFYTASAWTLGNGSSSAQNPSQVYNAAGTYNVQLVVTGRGGCTDIATKTINVFDAAATTLSYSPFSGCNPLPLMAVINSPADMEYSWDFGDGTIVKTMNDTTLHIYDVFGNYVPKVLLSDSGNCLIPLIGTDTVSIIGANAKFGWDRRAFCDSGTVAFLDSTTFNDPIVSYTWNFGDGNTSSVTTPVHSFASPGLYTVSLVVETQSACKDTFNVNQLVKVVESPSVRIIGDSVICQNDFVNYTGLFNRVDTSQVKWSWQFPNGGSSSFQVPAAQQFTAPGNFAVQVVATNTSGCTDTTTQDLLVNPIPVITIPSPQITPLATPIQLPATYTNNIVSYSWAPATGLTCTDCAQPFASPKFNTAYTVTAVDDKGCQNKGQVQVIVLCQNANVFVPNTFSPNSDGSNDVFYVRGKGLSRVKSLRIFNRWGEVVFDKANFAVNDPAVGWDGTYKGKKLPPDVYIYQVDVFCDNSESIRFDGSITLIL